MPNKRELDKEKMFRKIMPSSVPKKKDDETDTTKQGAPLSEDAPLSVASALGADGSGGKLSQDDIAALLAQMQGAESSTPDEPTAETAPAGAESPPVQAVDAPLEPVAYTPPEPVAPSPSLSKSDGKKLSPDDIASLFAQMQGTEVPKENTVPAETPTAAELAPEPVAEPQPVQAADAPPTPAAPSPSLSKSDGKKLSPDDIASLFAQMQGTEAPNGNTVPAEPPPAAEVAPEPVAEPQPVKVADTPQEPAAPAPSLSKSDGKKLSPDDIASLFAQMQGAPNGNTVPAETAPAAEPQPVQAGEAPQEPVAPSPSLSKSDGKKLSPDDIASLFAQMQGAEAPNGNTVPAETALAAELTPEPATESQSVQAADAPQEPAAPSPSLSKSDGKKLSPDDIASLFAQMQGTEAPNGNTVPTETSPAAELAPEPVAELAPETVTEPQPVPTADAPPLAEPQLEETAQSADEDVFSPTQAEPDTLSAAHALPADALPADTTPEPVQPEESSPEPTKLDIAGMYAQQHEKTLLQQELDSQNSADAFSSDVLPETPAAEIPAASAIPESEPIAVPQPINLSALMLEQQYGRYRERLNGCSCEKCKHDAMGIALNRITPRYITDDQLDTSQLEDRAMITECVTELVRALFVVKRSPQHDLAQGS